MTFRKIIFRILFYTFLGAFMAPTAKAQPFIDIYLSSQLPQSKGAAFSEIVETHEIYVSHKKEPNILKVTRNYSPSGKIVKEVKRNSAGGKNSETSWEYTPEGKIRKKTAQTFINMKGWITESSEFTYNDSTGNLEVIADYFDHKARRKAYITNNEEGNPVEIRILNERGVLLSIERLITIKASNCIRVLCFNANDSFVSSHNYPIDPQKPIPTGNIQREYNQQGDITIEMLSQKSQLNQGYYYEYEYDSYGNWTTKRTFQCSISANNKPKNKKLEYVITREIHY